MKVCFLSLPHLVLFLGTCLAQQLILCLSPEDSSGFIVKSAQCLAGPQESPHIKLAMNNTLAA